MSVADRSKLEVIERSVAGEGGSYTSYRMCLVSPAGGLAVLCELNAIGSEGKGIAERMAASWNACAGVETQYLEKTNSLREAAILRNRTLSEALCECADRLERCILHGGSDAASAAGAVARYREFVK